MSVSPSLREVNDKYQEEKNERERKRGDIYDPETSIYHSMYSVWTMG